MRSIGIDTGGTFTDLVAYDGAEVEVVKLHSTPARPARAVLAGLERLGAAAPGSPELPALDGARLVHGTTVALNALLTGDLPRTALVTNRGFADLIEIGRQDRAELYALAPSKPPALVPRALRFEVGSRDAPDLEGRIVALARPRAAELARLAARLRRARPASLAVCLLHSWADPAAEREVARALSELGVPITCSGELVPEHREFERFSTAVVNAALVPVMRAYVGELARALPAERLFLLQSSGGALSARRAAEEPVRVLLSGPAGGAVGAAAAARECGIDRAVTLDLGGTSADVAFVSGRAGSTAPARSAGSTAEPSFVAGHPIAVPALDVHTIGCGGGSLARVDAGGVLHVGPDSAGADPGPACHGRGTQPTLTDAHVVLGHIAGGAFLGGLPLERSAALAAYARLGRRLGVAPQAAAEAVVAAARAGMRRAVGRMSVERGHDPARLHLVAFGGGGGLHAAALVAALGLQGAIVPRHPGALSAWGMARAVLIDERATSVLQPIARWPRAARARVLARLARDARLALAASGARAREVRLEAWLELRYAGQAFELCVGEGQGARERFDRRHAEVFGYALADRPVELVCLRVRAVAGSGAAPLRPPRATAAPRAARTGERGIRCDGVALRAAVIDRGALPPGAGVDGPALIEEYSATTLVPPGFRARVVAGGHLLLTRLR